MFERNPIALTVMVSALVCSHNPESFSPMHSNAKASDTFVPYPKAACTAPKQIPPLQTTLLLYGANSRFEIGILCILQLNMRNMYNIGLK